MKNKVLGYILTVGDALSQLVNVAFLGFWGEVSANESISGRAYRISGGFKKPWYHPWTLAYHGINAIFFWQTNHCKEAFVNDYYRAELLIFRNETL